MTSPEQTTKLEQFLALLLEQNRHFNLTAITEPSEAWSKHVLDSLTLLPELAGLASGARVVDLGSGGGLPAIPLAIARDDLAFTLIETTSKKARFLEQVAATLQLSNVEVVAERAETFARGPARERFQATTSRALARLPVLLELSVPLLEVGGLMLAIKGEQAALEIEEAQRALRLLSAEVKATRRTETGVIVRIEKSGRTSLKYPRKPGEPKRAPL